MKNEGSERIRVVYCDKRILLSGTFCPLLQYTPHTPDFEVTSNKHSTT